MPAGLDLATRWLEDAHPQSRRPGVRLWVSAAIAPAFIFPAVGGLMRVKSATMLAAELASEATGLEPPCVATVEHWRPGVACLAVAMRRDTRDSLLAVARERRVRLRSLRPLWTTALTGLLAAHADASLVAVVDSDALTLLSGAGDDISNATTYAPTPDDAQLRPIVARARLAGALDSRASWLIQQCGAGVGVGAEPTPLLGMPFAFVVEAA